MVPVVQRELNIFKDTVWNSHRIRKQRHTLLPDGIPNHIYNFPEIYGLKECGKNTDMKNEKLAPNFMVTRISSTENLKREIWMPNCLYLLYTESIITTVIGRRGPSIFTFRSSIL